MSYVPLRRRDGSYLWALIDDEDDDLVMLRGRWYFDGKYAATKDGKRNLRLHAFLLGRKVGDPGDVDHINGRALDNRRCNLRVVPHAVNSRNVRSQGGTSKYRGVCWDSRRGLWMAQAKFNYQHHHLGRFASEEEAARVVEAFWRSVEENAA